MTDLTDKIALITGSARGIGKAIAERYASVGESSSSTIDRDREGANETVDCIERLGGTASRFRRSVEGGRRRAAV